MGTNAGIKNILNDYLKEIKRLDELFEKNRLNSTSNSGKKEEVNVEDKLVINKLTSLPELMRKLKEKKKNTKVI